MQELKIDGVISGTHADMMNFLDKFHTWLDSEGYSFGGITKPIEQEPKMYAIGRRNHVRGWDYYYGPTPDLQDCLQQEHAHFLGDNGWAVLELSLRDQNKQLYRWSLTAGKWIEINEDGKV